MKKSNPKVAGFDFDETVALFKPNKKIKTYITKRVDSVPNPDVVKLIKSLREKNIKVIIYSSRWWGDYNAVSNWLKKHNIEVDGIVLGRLKADVYICDKTINTFDEQLEKKVFNMLDLSESWGMYYNKYYFQVRKKLYKKKKSIKVNHG